MKSSLFILGSILAATSSLSAITLLHYSVSDSDAAGVAGGSIPGVDGSPNGSVAFGAIGLSENIPAQIPASGGNRSLVFNGASGINLPGTQQLLNSAIVSSGGFTMEAWFSYTGGGNINSIIDYAGTEKLVREAATSGTGYRNSSAAPLYILGDTTGSEWHYAAVVFSPTGAVAANGSITGDLTFYYDSTTPTSTEIGAVITDFGDSLNRTIGVGTHPVGFAGDFFNGLIYEPRVSTGALSASELLIASAVPEPGSSSMILGALSLLFFRRKR